MSKSPDRNVVLHGSDEPLQQFVSLYAGPFSVQLDGINLRYAKYRGAEVLRGVYVAVRDSKWTTVLMAISNFELITRNDSFDAKFEASHKLDNIDFSWNGRILGTAEGVITYEMRGIANSSFERNRIGICVLHPAACAGSAVKVVHTDRSSAESVFPEFISPHQPFFEIRSFSHQVFEGVWSKVDFNGDVFETEYQRNWTDASFKTYSTPLEIPYPVKVQAGGKISQSIQLSATSDPQNSATERVSPDKSLNIWPTSKVERFILQPNGSNAVDTDQQSPEAMRFLSELGLQYLRQGVVFPCADWRLRFDSAAEVAGQLNLALQIGVASQRGNEVELRALIDVVKSAGVSVHSWIVINSVQQPADATLLETIASEIPSVPIGYGSDVNFTELNSEGPDPEYADFITFPVNPQVHAFDDASVNETLSMHSSVLAAAREIYPDTPVGVGPVTLLPRTNSTIVHVPAGHSHWPADHRQQSMFAAVWMVGSISNFSNGGVDHLTYFEPFGSRGLIGAQGPTPAYWALREILEISGSDVVPVESSSPLGIAALRLTNRIMTLVACYASETISISIGGFGGVPTMRVLSADTVERASRHHESWSTGGNTLHPDSSGLLNFDVSPFSVSIIDQRH